MCEPDALYALAWSPNRLGSGSPIFYGEEEKAQRSHERYSQEINESKELHEKEDCRVCVMRLPHFEMDDNGGRKRKKVTKYSNSPRGVVHVLRGSIHFLDVMESLAQSAMALLDLLCQQILARGFTTVPFVRHPILTPK